MEINYEIMVKIMGKIRGKTNSKKSMKASRHPWALPLMLAAALTVFCAAPSTALAEGKAELAESQSQTRRSQTSQGQTSQGKGSIELGNPAAAEDGAENLHAPVVAVIDTGIDEDNPLIDYNRIFQAKSYVQGETSCDDKIGHGTAVAGIIQKYAPHAFIAPLMYFTAYPSGVPRNGGVAAICKAIYDAVDSYKCKIINISSGIIYESDELKAAIDYAETKNVIVISAVGNDNNTAADRVYYPAAYDTVIGVGAINSKKEIADFSQRNKSVMTVMYGVNIKVPGIKNGNRRVTVSGTSYAAAALCGIAAGIAEEYPDITPAQFRNLIKLSSRDLGEPGYDIAYGYGLPDIKMLKINLRLLAEAMANNPAQTED